MNLEILQNHMYKNLYKNKNQCNKKARSREKRKLWNSFLMKMNSSQNPLNCLEKLNNQIDDTSK